MQTTLAGPVSFAGRALHSGIRTRLTLFPAPAGNGIVFRRTDLASGDTRIPALWTQVAASSLCTRIGSGPASVSTIEHLMAALAGCGIVNARVDIDGPEVPILDGSAAPFVRGILDAGLRRQDAPLHGIRVLSPIEVRDGAAMARLDPAEALEIDFGIEFAGTAIGAQAKRLGMANGAFVHELSNSRTFCLLADVESMRARGLARGGSFENALVFEGARLLSPGGLRHPDEPVRHKMLDALGDLALAGAPLLARYTGRRAGHALTAALLRALFAQPQAWEWVELGTAALARLPGAGLGLPPQTAQPLPVSA